MGHDLSRMSGVAMLEQIDALPGPEGKLAIGDRNRQRFLVCRLKSGARGGSQRPRLGAGGDEVC
jgi:hypothetical protein